MEALPWDGGEMNKVVCEHLFLRADLWWWRSTVVGSDLPPVDLWSVISCHVPMSSFWRLLSTSCVLIGGWDIEW
jgi:hypothetical protein